MHNESMSALLDGECTAADLDRLLEACERSPELKAQWSRLWLAREVRHGLHAARADLDFSSRVVAALEHETPAQAESGIPPRTVIPLPLRATPARHWQPLVGLAAAASVAALAFTLWSQRQPAAEPLGPVLATASVPAAPADSAGFQPVAASVTAAEAPADSPLAELRERMDSEFERQLEAYVLDHSNYRMRPGTSGTLGYARFAAHNATQKAVYTTDEQH